MAGKSSSFYLLDERIQRFIWAEGWESLRDAQEAAIPAILAADRDVVVAAATAAGKTEAAFLPALTHLLSCDKPGLIVYVSPLKALINDQFGRLQRLCEQLEIPVWPWHGDVVASVKARFLKQPRGVLLITPESLEALLCSRVSSLAAAMRHMTFFVIDELHAFIGAERGKQLQSLMHRLELLVGRRIPRIGLSATLGDMRLACEFLRPGHGAQAALVASASSGNDLRILVKGYEELPAQEPVPVIPSTSAADDDPDKPDEDEWAKPQGQIAKHLFNVLRGSNNLVFPNSRREVERYTSLLRALCEQERIPNEFWPHHGSLSKQIRSETEEALKRRDHPATAICTSTLELGIDIGAVKSVAQLQPPPSVASLRQRLGRSGRRAGEPAILRGYCIEEAIDPKSGLAAVLRLGTVQMAAMILLLLEAWFEPPRAHGLHLSTLVQQVLSLVAQRGGATIGQLWSSLCAPHEPFESVSKQDFAALLRHLGQLKLLAQDSSGLLLHGEEGERHVNHYSFYAAFASDEEFRVVARGKTLGTLPVSQMLMPGQRVLFAGKTWRIDEVDEAQKTIYVSRTRGGAPPMFAGSPGRVHTRVRRRMRELLESDETPSFLDAVTKRFLSDARQVYASIHLAQHPVIDMGGVVVVLTWLGDSANEALACLLLTRGLLAACDGPGVEIQKGSRTLVEILDELRELASEETPGLDVLLKDVTNLKREKWDWALPDELLRKSYASLYLDIDEAIEWVREHGAALTQPPVQDAELDSAQDIETIFAAVDVAALTGEEASEEGEDGEQGA